MSEKLKILVTIILLSLLIIIAIGLYEILYDDKLETFKFSSKILLENAATEEGVDNVIYSYNQFAFDLYHEITNGTNDNVFFSPFSIYIALSMIYEGANENTAQEIANVLYFRNNDDIQRGSFAKIQNDINNREAKCRLALSNNVWVQKGFQIKDDFIYNVDNYYFAYCNEINFFENPDESRKIINQWVDDETEGKIKNFLPSGLIDTETVMALTNAIYFSGDWKQAFNKDDIRDDKFYLENNQTKMVSMMNIYSDKYKNIGFNLYNNKTLGVLELPYKGDSISMFILLPTKTSYLYHQPGLIYGLEDELSYEYYNGAIGKLTHEDEFYIRIPKFTFASEYDLKGDLKTMGMKEAFCQSADFSGITDECPLWIDEAYHKAFITVNEKGTVAAAASSSTTTTGIPPQFIANHPFFFTIQDKATGLILFMGRLMDPPE